jgi:diguanylate cyclase (GGDEF)-like protein
MADPAWLETSRPTILVVEDQPGLREHLRAVLAAAPLCADVLLAPNGAVGLRVAMTQPVDCVLCDLEMPVMDGLSFLRAVRAHRSRFELPVLLVTSSSALVDKVACFRHGASDFLSKPLEPEEVVARAQTHASMARMVRQLAAEAHTDPLTGLLNRRHFMDALLVEMKRATRVSRPLTLALVDVDRFQEVNDEHGHPAGDVVLVGFGRVVASGTRAYDVVGRVAGSRFAVLLPETALRDGVALAERLRGSVERAALGALRPGAVTASLGVAGGLLGSQDTDDSLLALAEEQLHRAKRGGRNRVCAAPELTGEDQDYPRRTSTRPQGATQHAAEASPSPSRTGVKS